MQGWRRLGPWSSLLPLRDLQGNDKQVDHNWSGHMMQVPCSTVIFGVKTGGSRVGGPELWV